MTNQDLLNIAQEFGTPVYVYDADSIKTQYEKLKTSFGEQTKFFYACKSLTNINILKYVEKLGANLDCVSINGEILRRRTHLLCMRRPRREPRSV